MDHQSVGLIARGIEEAGIPTVYLGSCKDIMDHVRAPRNVFLNFPLGRQCGRPDKKNEQLKILKAALTVLTTATTPGEIVDLPYKWDHPFEWEDFMKDVTQMLKEEGIPIQDWKPKQ